MTLLSGGVAAPFFESRSNQADADQSYKVYFPLIAKTPPIPPLSQELVQEAYQFYSLGDPVPPTSLRFEFKPNLNHPDQPAIVFARDPETREIILATRFNPETQEQEWHVAKLRDLADIIGIGIGTNLSPWFDAETVRKHNEIVKDNFNHAIIDAFHMTVVMPEVDIFNLEATQFNFQEAREAINLAKANGMTVESMPIICGHADFDDTWSRLKRYRELAEQSGFVDAVRENISWDQAYRMNSDPAYGNQLIEELIDTLPDPQKREEWRETRNKLCEFIVYYTQQLVSEFQGEIDIWRVVNEFDINPRFIWDPYFYLVGPDYPDLVFQAARDVDPTAKLIINPASAGHEYFFGITAPVVQRLKEKGIIDGVGEQAHEKAPEPFDWEARFALLEEYGVEILITERDVDLRDIQGTDEERFRLQAEIYAYSLREALNHNIDFFTLWESFGDDEDSWLERAEGGDPKADPTIFDDYHPKPAYFSLKDVLQAIIDQE